MAITKSNKQELSLDHDKPNEKGGWILCYSLKALVWFWLIDETLSANLVYQSNYEIGSTTPSDEAMTKIMMVVMAMVMIKVLGLGKEEREKQKAQDKGDIHRSFCVLVIKTLRECDHIEDR